MKLTGVTDKDCDCSELNDNEITIPTDLLYVGPADCGASGDLGLEDCGGIAIPGGFEWEMYCNEDGSTTIIGTYTLGAIGIDIRVEKTFPPGTDCCDLGFSGNDTAEFPDLNCDFENAVLHLTPFNCTPQESVSAARESARPESPKEGPGTELAKLISYFIWSRQCSKCKLRVNLMNKWGPDKCEENINVIKSWLRQSASKKGVPYVDSLVTVLIKRAIRNSRRK